jgi:hypothetical protein
VTGRSAMSVREFVSLHADEFGNQTMTTHQSTAKN